MLDLSLLEAKGIQLSVLMAELESTFPPVNPQPQDSVAKIMYQSGQRSVIEFINNYLQDN